MSKNKLPRPARTERDRLFEALLGPDEEIDSESARQILQAHGIEPSELISKFKAKLDEEARKLRLQGIPVPPSMQNALHNLKAGPVERLDPTANDPSAWLNSLLSGALQSSRQQAAYSLRPRKPGQHLTGKDQNILDMLSAEIEEEEKSK